MKHVLVVAILAVLLAAPAQSQEATPKPARKRLFFLPGSKKPEPTPEPATPAATPKATPKVTPKPTTPRATPKPTPSATPKPEATPEPKPAATSEPKPEDKLRGTMVETVGPMPATPPPATPKPAATPAPVKAAATPATSKATPAPAPAKAAQGTAAGGNGVVFGAVVPMVERPATPAVITSTVPPEPAQIVRAFFGQLGKGDIDGAYANLMKGSKIADRPEEIRLLKAKTKDAIDIFGVIHGYDLVDLKPVGERLMRATYLSLGHELPLRWRFYFYKAEDDWKLIDIRVDDKLTGIFDEAKEEPPDPRP